MGPRNEKQLPQKPCGEKKMTLRRKQELHNNLGILSVGAFSSAQFKHLVRTSYRTTDYLMVRIVSQGHQGKVLSCALSL